MTQTQTKPAITQVEPGHCPKCGSNKIMWGSSEADGDMRWYEADCENCNAELREYRTEVFIGWTADGEDFMLPTKEHDRLKAERDELLEALVQISRAANPFSPLDLTQTQNTVQMIAQAAITKAESSHVVKD